MLEGFFALLSLVRDGLVPFFELFRDERIAIGLAILLIVVAIGSALWFWLGHARPWLRALRQAKNRIVATADAADFYDRFAEIDAVIGGNSRLAHSWNEFKESLIFPEDTAGRRMIRNTARPQLYFNVPAAVDAGLPLPAYLALPNIFVGLGLLFTFIGLVAALHFAAQGVTSPDVATAQGSLQGLLKAATFKFMTSIAGVFISIVLAVFFRRLVGRLRSRFEKFCGALEQRMRFVSAESLAAEQLREAEKQSLQLERFNTDFAVELAGVLDQKLNATLSASLREAVQPVVGAVQSLSGAMGSMNQDAITTMVADFKRGLTQSTGDEMRSLITALGDVRQTLDHAAKGLQADGADFGSRLDQVARDLERRLGDATQLMSDGLAASAARLETLLGGLGGKLQSDAEGASARLSDAIGSAAERTRAILAEAGAAFSACVRQTATDFAAALASSTAALPSLEQTLRQLDGRFSEQVSALDQSIDRLQALSAELERGSRELRDAAAPIAATAGHFALAAERIDAAGTSLQTVQAGLRDLSGQIAATFRSNEEVWQEYRRRFEQVDQHLAGVVKALLTGTTEHRQEIERFVTEMDGQLAKAVGSFSAAVNELQELAEEVAPMLQQAASRDRHAQATAGKSVAL